MRSWHSSTWLRRAPIGCRSRKCSLVRLSSKGKLIAPITAAAFLGQLRQIKGYLDAHPQASEGLSGAHDALLKAFKSTYTTDDFKQALASGAEIDSNLEELVTSAVMQLNQERLRSK